MMTVCLISCLQCRLFQRCARSRMSWTFLWSLLLSGVPRSTEHMHYKPSSKLRHIHYNRLIIILSKNTSCLSCSLSLTLFCFSVTLTVSSATRTLCGVSVWACRLCLGSSCWNWWEEVTSRASCEKQCLDWWEQTYYLCKCACLGSAWGGNTQTLI